MVFCPNCSARLDDAKAIQCWNCQADFGGAGAWKPLPRASGEYRPFAHRIRPEGADFTSTSADYAPVFSQGLRRARAVMVSLLVTIGALLLLIWSFLGLWLAVFVPLARPLVLIFIAALFACAAFLAHAKTRASLLLSGILGGLLLSSVAAMVLYMNFVQ